MKKTHIAIDLNCVRCIQQCPTAVELIQIVLTNNVSFVTESACISIDSKKGQLVVET